MKEIDYFKLNMSGTVYLDQLKQLRDAVDAFPNNTHIALELAIAIFTVNI